MPKNARVAARVTSASLAYLGRLYDQSEGRPRFMIRDKVGGAIEMAAAARTGVAILAPTAHPPDYPDCR
jgi:hypothetical protein